MNFPFNLDCGESSIKVDNIRKSRIGSASCGRCGLTEEVLVNFKSDPVYFSGLFIAINSADQELQRLETRIEQLNKDRAREGWKDEMRLCCLITLGLCRAKVAEAREGGAAVNRDEVKKWQSKALDYSNKIEKLYADVFRERRRGYYLPYPYIFKPPEPPDDIGVATNMQLKKPVKEEAPEVELFCRYCGSKLRMDESFCSVCGKKS